MRFLFSYGLAIIIIVVLAAWLATGVLVTPGNGPGNGETPVVVALEGADGGPITTALEQTGLTKAEEHHEGPDPHLTIAEREAANTGASAPVRSVRIATYTMQAMPIQVPLRGRTKASSSVSVMPETAGTVREVRVTKGQQVAVGDVLCTLDEGTRMSAVQQASAALAQAQASYEQAKAQLETNTSLREKGLAAENTARNFEVAVAAAEASVRAAQAAVENAQAEWGRLEVKATVAGVIQEPLASRGQMLGGGSPAPCATIVQLDPMLFIGTVPEARVAYAKLGLPATITTVTGQTVEGKVSFIAATADQATRSFPVEIEIPNPTGAVLDGVTASAIVNVGTAPAHLLPQSVLTLDDEGVLGVRAVEDSKVVFYAITILSDSRDGVWVTGLPPRADIITVGQEYVQPGQIVNAAYGPADATETPAAPAGETHS